MSRTSGPTLRIPLQTGSGTLRVLRNLAAVPGALIAVAILLVGGDLALPLGGFAVVVELILVLAPIAELFAAKASDLRVTREGLWTEGVARSPYARLTPWSQLATDAWRAADSGRGMRLEVGRPRPTVLARVGMLHESWSIAATADAIRATAERYAARGHHQRAVAPSLLCCSSCGAPAFADDAPSVTCRWCRGAVAVPDPVRERIRTARRLRLGDKLTPRMIQKLLDQPGAFAANLALLVAGVVMSCAFPAALAIALGLDMIHELTMLRQVALVLLAAAVIAGAYLLAASVVDERRGLQHASLRLGSAGGTDAEICRNCSAPLAAPPGHQVVACDYCAAPNLIGIDLGARAVESLEEERTLVEELEGQQQRRRRRLLVGAAIALVFVVASVAFVAGGSDRPL